MDEIYNLACPASPVYYQKDPIQTTKVNVLGSINMLGMAKRVKAKILQASTSEIYGDPEEHPQRETYWGRVNPIGPRACYDEKALRRTLSSTLQQNSQYPVIRIFNTYPAMSVATPWCPISSSSASNETHHLCTHQPVVLLRDDLIDGYAR